jgi:hypothetical protein
VLPPRPERLARQRRRHAQERTTKRVAALGFADVRAFLEGRVIDQERLLAEVAAGLAADRRTVRRLVQQAGVTRRQRTARQLAVGEQSRRVRSVPWQARRAARLEELGSADLGVYLQRGYREQVWRLKRMGAERRVAAIGWWRRWHGSACGDALAGPSGGRRLR